MIDILAIEHSDTLSQEVFNGLLSFVSEERKLRAKRFLRREDACRCIVGEALARYCLGKRENVPPMSIEFLSGEHGKPYVAMPEKTQFSISHSGSWVVFAADNQPIGIDVERIHNVNLDIADRFFSSRERDCIVNLLTDEARKDRFFDFWTLKESYIKAIGKGLSCPLSGFSIIFDSNPISMIATHDLPIMHFKRYPLCPGYKCAVCATHETFPLKIQILPPQHLLSFLLA